MAVCIVLLITISATVAMVWRGASSVADTDKRWMRRGRNVGRGGINDLNTSVLLTCQYWLCHNGSCNNSGF